MPDKVPGDLVVPTPSAEPEEGDDVLGEEAQRTSIVGVQRPDKNLLSPEAVELLATKPRWAARSFVYLLVPLLVSALAWSALSKVDVIVVARAVLAAEGDVLKVRAPMEGVLRSIAVREGETVAKGAVLFELASREAAREVVAIKRAEQRLVEATAELNARFPEKARVAATRVEKLKDRLRLLGELEQKNAELGQKAEAESARVIEANRLALENRRARLPQVRSEVELREASAARLKDAQKKKEELKAQGIITEAEVNTARDRADEAQIGVMRARADAAEVEGEVRKLELEAARLQQALSVRLAELDKETIQSRASAAALAAEVSQIQGDLVLEKAQLEGALAQAKLEAEGSQRVVFEGVAGDSVVLRSPVDGIVTAVQVAQKGELVRAGDLILRIRPKNAPLVAQAKVQNRDIGHVSSGLPARIKYDAYPFVDYGIKSGRVTRVAADSTQDPELGPIYEVTIAPDESTIVVDGRPQPLAFGLEATVEIVTEQRSVLSFFLTPLRELADGARAMPR